jgi:hypothetical protein
MKSLLESVRGRGYADSKPPKGSIQRRWFLCCLCEHLLHSSLSVCNKCRHEICEDCHAKQFPVLSGSSRLAEEVEEEEDKAAVEEAAA